jgi:hypothetical protein
MEGRERKKKCDTGGMTEGGPRDGQGGRTKGGPRDGQGMTKG